MSSKITFGYKRAVAVVTEATDTRYIFEMKL